MCLFSIVCIFAEIRDKSKDKSSTYQFRWLLNAMWMWGAAIIFVILLSVPWDNFLFWSFFRLICSVIASCKDTEWNLLLTQSTIPAHMQYAMQSQSPTHPHRASSPTQTYFHGAWVMLSIVSVYSIFQTPQIFADFITLIRDVNTPENERANRWKRKEKPKLIPPNPSHLYQSYFAENMRWKLKP